MSTMKHETSVLEIDPALGSGFKKWSFLVSRNAGSERRHGPEPDEKTFASDTPEIVGSEFSQQRLIVRSNTKHKTFRVPWNTILVLSWPGHRLLKIIPFKTNNTSCVGMCMIRGVCVWYFSSCVEILWLAALCLLKWSWVKAKHIPPDLF